LYIKIDMAHTDSSVLRRKLQRANNVTNRIWNNNGQFNEDAQTPRTTRFELWYCKLTVVARTTLSSQYWTERGRWWKAEVRS
jgi:hypothetical protein